MGRALPQFPQSAYACLHCRIRSHARLSDQQRLVSRFRCFFQTLLQTPVVSHLRSDHVRERRAAVDGTVNCKGAVPEARLDGRLEPQLVLVEGFSIDEEVFLIFYFFPHCL